MQLTGISKSRDFSSVFGGRYGEELSETASPGDQTVVPSQLGPKQGGGEAVAAATGLPSWGSGEGVSTQRREEPPHSPAVSRESVRQSACPFSRGRQLLFGSASSELIETGLEFPSLLAMGLFKARAQTARLASGSTARGFSLVVFALNLGTINLSKND